MPPDKLTLHGLVRGAAEPTPKSRVLLRDIDAETYQCAPDAGSRAVISALRTLQEKMRRLELERAQAEKNVQRFADVTQKHINHHHTTTSTSASRSTMATTSTSAATSSIRAQEPAAQPRDDPNSKYRTELVAQLQSAESRCSLLEKQLDYMKKMLRSAGETEAHKPSPASTHTKPPPANTHTQPPPNNTHTQPPPVNTHTEAPATNTHQHTQPPPERKAQKENCIDDIQLQLNKLDKLERECVKLTNTQSLAERKIQLLEKRLQEEEKERKLIQRKADELQRELQVNLLMQSASLAESKPTKKKKKEKSPTRESEPVPKLPIAKRPPFVAGTSTSPSHSVSANLQALRHLLRQQQQQQGGRLEGAQGSRKNVRECERHRRLEYGDGGGERSSARQQARPGVSRRSEGESRQGRARQRGQGPGERSPPSREASPLGSLSQLLLALQDELGRMSFEHQELVCQIADTRSSRVREDLERELDALVRKMEDKATQITQLRKHQRTVESLRQTSRSPKKQPRATGSKVKKTGITGVQPLSPSPKKTRPHSVPHSLYSSLRKDDIIWES
ncbi:hypothetical protein ACEWY4_022041 [Coilia grayii]|uniref:Centrosomal protein 57kDa-like protein 1 n=1 Tax=Coilia grayii TaxID=363190 RepID=A0ABD1J4Y4_9TELE